MDVRAIRAKMYPVGPEGWNSGLQAQLQATMAVRLAVLTAKVRRALLPAAIDAEYQRILNNMRTLYGLEVRS